jgi:hypothetical protein
MVRLSFRHTLLRPALLALALLLALAPGAALAASSDSRKADPKAKEAAAGEEKPFDEVVKDMEVVKGWLTFYRKTDENKVLLEVLPSQIDSIFLFAATLDRGIGERGLYASMMQLEFPPGCIPVYFHRSGKTLQWFQKNTRFTAEPGTPPARAVDRSYANSILGSAKLQSKPHPERKSLLIDASELFSQRDLLGLGVSINRIYDPSSYQFDRERSAIADVKAFDESALLDVALHFTTETPKVVSLVLPDARSLPVTVKYQLSALRHSPGFHPRVVDDRVGYYHTIRQDYTSDRPSTPFVRYAGRWNLEKADPSAALSPPKKPIVFWLENTIPAEYREAFTQGVLLWNKAFERIGFQDAIVVKQQPDDAAWDPADTRYSTIRWFQGIDAGFAIGPSRWNPFTGEIYDADIGFSEVMVRNVRRAGEELVSPIRFDWNGAEPTGAAGFGRQACSYGAGMAEQLAFGAALLDARGELSPELEERLIREYVTEVVAHEVGHTLGLRHNFRGSTILPPKELHDPARTAQVGQSASLMDYNPLIIAPKGTPQGDFIQTVLGPYDYWAIEYGYKPIEGDEKEELAKIAARGASDPMLPYSTDEDVDDPLPGASIDPLAMRFDASSDPLGYVKERVALTRELWGNLDTKLARPGEGYQVMRRSLQRGLNEYGRSVAIASRFIGGIYHRRDHVGDPGGSLPFTPVPADRQREALSFLSANAFGEGAFRLPAGTHRRLAVERLEPIDWFNYYRTTRLDMPWHDAVLGIQRIALDRLFAPITLSRLLDSELMVEPRQKPFRMADLFRGLDASIWSELDTGKREIPAMRRNLQREHLKRLVRMAIRTDAAASGGFGFNPQTPPPSPALPEDATTLARASLIGIQAKIRGALALKTPLDATTRAHLQETSSRITAALDARLQRSVQ